MVWIKGGYVREKILMKIKFLGKAEGSILHTHRLTDKGKNILALKNLKNSLFLSKTW